jgi:TetR/AcrR family transcriptional regulator, transcriptional repressor for nem operon
MSKAQVTKDYIIQQAAGLFNRQGYVGSSIADVMAITGLKKGGIYNHFQSKEELALAAFDYTVQQVQQRYSVALRGKRQAKARVQAVIETFCELAIAPAVPGGCPILNTAIESDDTHPVLRDRARQAMDSWQQTIEKILGLGIDRGEIPADTDVRVMTRMIIATLEGALMMTQLYGDLSYLKQAQQHLLDYIERALSP